MLDLIREMLVELGLLTEGAATHFAVDLTTGNNFLVNVYADNGAFFHVRVSEDVDLSSEFDIARQVHQSLGRFVPRAIAHARRPAFNCIVFEGVDLTQVSSERALKCGVRGGLSREIAGFFELTAARQAQFDSKPTLSETVHGLYERFSGTEQEPSLERAVKLVHESALERLPGISQHGDLVLNNLGLANGRLIVYDWEDFDKTTLRGLDLGVLVASACKFSPEALCELRRKNRHGSVDRKAGWLLPSCRALGLEIDEFWAAMPLYMFVFLKLKDPYSSHIRSMVGRAIVGLL